MLAWLVFAGLPLLVLPWFLDYAEEAKTVALLAIVAAAALRLAFRRGSASAPGRRGWWGITALVVGLSVLGCLWAPKAQVAWHAVRNEWLAVLAAGLLAAFVDRRKALTALFVGAALVGTLGIAQAALNLHFLTPASDPGQFPGVTFGNRGLASLFVALGLAPGLYLYERRALPRALVGAGIAVQVLFVFVAMTRAVWLGCLLAAAVLLLLRHRQRRREAAGALPVPRTPPSRRVFLLRLGIPVGLIALVAVGAGIVLHNDALMTLLKQRLELGDWTGNPRLVLWQAALGHFLAAGPRVLAVGFGPGAFQVLAPEWLAATPLAGRVFLDAHNDLLQVLLEYGILGAALRVAMIGYGLYAVGRAAARQGSETAPVLLANALLLLTASQFFYPLHLPYFLALGGFFLMAEAIGGRRLVLPVGLRPLAVAVAAAALFLAGQRVVVETSMRSYVKEPRPYFVKAVEGLELRRRLENTSMPYIYLQILTPKHLVQAAGAADSRQGGK